MVASQLLLLAALVHCSVSLTPQVLDVDYYKELRTWKSSSLFEVIPKGNSSYVHNPLLLYSEGSRYGLLCILHGKKLHVCLSVDK